MGIPSFGRASFLLTILVAIPFGSQASIVTVPTGLQPGDVYRLVFVTSGSTAATSTSISTYDSFVTSAANAVSALSGLNATWLAIASVTGVSASSHVGTSSSTVGIYNLNGDLVANGTAGLFGSTPPTLLAAMDYTELDAVDTNVSVWTGTAKSGSASFAPLGTSAPKVGTSSGTTGGTWLSTSGSSTDTNTNLHPLYAISSEIVVTATPEPGTIGLTLLGLGIAFAAGRRRAGDGVL